MTYMSTNVFQFTADNIRLDIIRKFKGRKYLVRISLILFKLSRIFSHLNQEIFYFVIDFCHALFTYSLYKKRNTKSICGSQKWYSCPCLYMTDYLPVSHTVAPSTTIDMVLTCKIAGRNSSPHRSISVTSRDIYRLISINGVVIGDELDTLGGF